MNGKVKNLLGKKYNRLTVISFLGAIDYVARWECKCDCGKIVRVRSDVLQSGRTKSCGCYKKDNPGFKKHGEALKTKEYAAWRNMKRRCVDKKSIGFKYWGGKGITVCERWMKYENFLADMGRIPIGHTLDRIEGSKNYEPNNCRWATYKEQNNNKSNTRHIEYNGERLTLTQWAEKINTTHDCLASRMQRGWSIERIMNQKPRRSPKARI